MNRTIVFAAALTAANEMNDGHRETDMARCEDQGNANVTLGFVTS